MVMMVAAVPVDAAVDSSDEHTPTHPDSHTVLKLRFAYCTNN